MLAAAILAAILLAPAAAHAQDGLAGTVSDMTGLVLPGVTVEARSTAGGGAVRTATTDNLDIAARAGRRISTARHVELWHVRNKDVTLLEDVDGERQILVVNSGRLKLSMGTVDNSRLTAPTVAAGVLEAAKGFRRVQGCQDMPALVAALRARDARLGLGESSEMVT